MLDTSQNIFLVVVSIVLSMTWLVLVNRFWEPTRRSVHNNVIGWQIGILGTIYAVLVGFMLYAVWTNFQTAEVNADNEANALVNLSRTADGLPTTQRDEIQKLAQQYVRVVLTEEWPAMARQESGNSGQPIVVRLWAVMTQTPTLNPTQQISLAQAMSELSSMTKHRRIRQLESRSEMPTILWSVLVTGGMITIGASCLIGSENAALHFILICAPVC